MSSPLSHMTTSKMSEDEFLARQVDLYENQGSVLFTKEQIERLPRVRILQLESIAFEVLGTRNRG